MLSHDLRHSFRLLLRYRRTSLATVLMLGLGIGANVALFTIVNAAFLRPLPFQEPERLVFLYGSFPGLSREDLANFSYPDFLDVRRDARSFEAIAAQTDFTAAAIEGRDGPARVQPNFVDGPYFEILGTVPSSGRNFTERDLTGGAPVTVLSHALWHRLFGGDPSIVGRSIRVNGIAFEVIGVMPEGFVDLAERQGRLVDMWMPLRTAPRVMSSFVPDNRAGRLIWGVARLRPGITAEDAEHELQTISAELERIHPDTNRGFGVHASPLRSIFFRELRQPLTLLAMGAGFVLLIVCCNVAVLLVARGTARQRELAVRLALGASRGRIARQLLVEALVLAALAAVVSVVVAHGATALLVAYEGVDFPDFIDVRVDPLVLLSAVALAAVAGIVAGLVPAFSGWRQAVAVRLASGSSPRLAQRSRAQLVLVAVQVASAVVLVAGAWLMVSSSLGLAAAGLNFNTERLLMLRIDLPTDRYGTPAARAIAGEALRDRLARIPGAAAATVWGPGTPGRSTWVAFIAPEGRAIESPSDFQMVWRHSTNPGGLRDLGITLLEGRDFTSADTAAGMPVVIVGRSVARELWPDGNPIGRRMRTGTAPNAPMATVIGVADDVWMRGRFRFGALDPRRIPQRDIYFPYAQRPNAGLVLLVRSAIDPAGLTESVRAAVRDVDPGLPLYDLRTIRDVLSDEERNVRLAAVLMAVYGTLSLLFAGAGLYAVLSFAVVRRTHEIGLRMALGAARRHVIVDISRPAMWMVALGCAAGLIAVTILSPLVRTLFYNVSPVDPRVLGGTCVLLTLAAVVASWVPAWRAATVDPVVALREE